MNTRERGETKNAMKNKEIEKLRRKRRGREQERREKEGNKELERLFKEREAAKKVQRQVEFILRNLLMLGLGKWRVNQQTSLKKRARTIFLLYQNNKTGICKVSCLQHTVQKFLRFYQLICSNLLSIW